MGHVLGRRLAGWASAVAFSVIVSLAAGAVTAQPAFTSGNWSTADGGVVAVEAGGAYNASFTDETTNAPVFASGKVIAKKPTADGKLELSIKLAAPVPGVDSYAIDVDSTGNAEMFAIKGGERHKAATLSK